MITQHNIGQNHFNFKKFTKKMCSSEFHGRGYVNNGDSIAADFIANEMLLLDIDSLPTGYFQPFKLDIKKQHFIGNEVRGN